MDLVGVDMPFESSFRRSCGDIDVGRAVVGLAGVIVVLLLALLSLLDFADSEMLC